MVLLMPVREWEVLGAGFEPHLTADREFAMTVRRFWKAASAFCFTAARLADCPDLNASFSAL